MNDAGSAFLEAADPGLDQDKLNAELNAELNAAELNAPEPATVPSDPAEDWIDVVENTLRASKARRYSTTRAEWRHVLPSEVLTAAAVVVVAHAIFALTDEVRKVVQEIRTLRNELP